MSSLDAFFRPRSIAVVGASPDHLTIGHRVLENLLAYRFTGRVFPVHPKAAEVCGLPAFRALAEIPGDVDLVHVVVRATSVLERLEECARKGARAVIVHTSGFREVGAEGAALEKLLAERARALGIRVFGPNCQGVMNTESAYSLYANFTFARIRPGVVSIVAQGGGVAEVLNNDLQERGVGLRMYASNGNACDVSIPEILEYYGADDGCRVVVLHMESVPDPRALVEVGLRVSRVKPILALKSGTTREGARAVASHTGGLAEEDLTTDLVLEKAGIVRLRTTRALCDAAKALAMQGPARGRRVAIVTNAGSPAICAADHAAGAGLELPEPSAATVEALRPRLHPTSALHNPLDLMATATPEHYGAAVRAVLSDGGYDAVLVSFITPFFVDCEAVARAVAALAPGAAVPLVANVMASPERPEVARILEAAGVPTYDFPEEAAAVLSAMARQGELAARRDGTIPSLSGVDAHRARALVDRVLTRGGGMLAPDEAAELALSYGISQPPWGLTATPEGAMEIATALGFPVVLKAVAEGLVHRSDERGVVLGLRDAREVRAAGAELLARFAARAPRLLVQAQAAEGVEVIVGASAVSGLGHTVVFGLGGVLVEVLKDVACALAPVTSEEAARMVRGLRGEKVLLGTRGRPGVDLSRLEELICRVSRLVTDLPEVVELDLNPVIAAPGRGTTMAVDVRVRVARREGG